MKNTLICGDNLEVLRQGDIPDESIDLVYLDPPFNSDQTYNLLFKKKDGALGHAFKDTWQWGPEAQRDFHDVLSMGGKLEELLTLFRALLDETDMLAYLSMMAPRLVELRRVLKASGSIYLHCDPTASHYLKLLMDAVFGPANFRNEVVWQRTNAHSGAKQYGRIHDCLLFYTKSDQYTWNQVSTDYGASQLKRYKKDPDGRLYKGENLTADRINSDSGKFSWRGTMPGPTRGWAHKKEQLEKWWAEGRILTKRDGTPRMDGLKVYLDEMPGKALQSLWTDIPRIANTSGERVGYPTQKPEALLRRIVLASSNPGDVVLDPFCGCGTTIDAARHDNRRWIGIDISIDAIDVIREERLSGLTKADYQMIYRPSDMRAASAFASQQPFDFQDWAVEKLNGVPSKRRSGDRGVDGRCYFKDSDKGPLRQIIVSVKSGKLSPAFVRELQGAVETQRACMGVLLTMQEPSKQMIRDAASSDVYGKYPRTQIITVEQILSGQRLNLPDIEKMGVAGKRVASVDVPDQPGLFGAS